MTVSEFAALCEEIALELDLEQCPELEEHEDDAESDIVMEFNEIFEDR
jgi:hypothetical protein